MFLALRPLGLALAGVCLLPLAASAVPIRAADGVPTSVPGSKAGPRHPGVIPLSPLAPALSASTVSPNRRGRPVPSLSKATTPNDSPRARVAEGVSSSAARQL